MDYIFIDSGKDENKIGMVENNRLVEYHIEERKDKRIRGNIYRARVINVLRGMNAAFVDIGERQNAYLPLKEALNDVERRSINRYNITDVLKGGDIILAQVVREPVGDKGAKITTRLSFPGRYMVLTPYSGNISISKRIENTEEIERLEAIGENIKTKDRGMIFRTASLGLDEELLKEEYEYLNRQFEKILSERDFLPVPKNLYKEANLAINLIKDGYNPRRHRIIVNSKEVYEEILSLEDYFKGDFKERVEYRKDFSIYSDRKILEGIDQALKKEVKLKSGGSIVIEETEALTSIDINTGKYTGEYSLQDTVYKTNLEATKEIARQIRLRDLGGIIIIDLISMDNNQNTTNVIDSLRKEFREDRNRPYIIGLTKLGLLEVTRRRKGNSLLEEISSTCPECHGSGRINKKN